MTNEVAELIERWPLILEFKLPPDSNVIVVGAYRGLAMQALADLYNPAQIVGYEPQSWAAQEATERLLDYPNCQVIPFGLWPDNYTGLKPMGEWHTDACSFVNTGPGSRDQGTGAVMDANLALAAIEFSNHIDLVVMNIEGGEYELIPYLRKHGWLRRIDRLAVQWHYGLGSDPKDDSDVLEEMEGLKDYFELIKDERPAWTYFVKAGI